MDEYQSLTSWRRYRHRSGRAWPVGMGYRSAHKTQIVGAMFPRPHKAKMPFTRGSILFDHFCAGNVAGHQVWGELDPAEIQAQGFGDC